MKQTVLSMAVSVVVTLPAIADGTAAAAGTGGHAAGAVSTESVFSADETYGFNFTVNDSDMTATLIAAGSEVDPYEGDIVVPGTIVKGGKTYTVTTIGDVAFRDSHITSVKLPETIREIKNTAFSSCPDLESVELNEGLATLNWDVFSATPKLKSIEIPGTVRVIPFNAFGHSGIETLVINPGVETIEAAFTDCRSLKKVVLPETVTSLDGTFNGCSSLTEIALPSSLRSIHSLAFAATGITELVIPEGVETIDMMALGHMNGDWNADYTLRKVVLPASLKSIGNMAFNNRRGLETIEFNGAGETLIVNAKMFSNNAAPLTTLVLGRKLADAYGNDLTATLINDKASTLTDITIADGVTELPALTGCANIRRVTVNAAVPPAAGGFHSDVYANAELHVPAGAEAAYAAADVWREFANLIIPAAVSDIDINKIRYTVGEGANLYAVMLRFGNDERLDNLIYGYRSDDDAVTARTAIEAIAAIDRRLNITTDENGAVAVSFDLDGNDMIDARDVTAADNGDLVWSTDDVMLASDGVTKVLTLGYASQPGARYNFYLPSPDETGVWSPESMSVRLSDKGFVLPVLVQPQGSAISNTTNWQASSSADSYKLDRTIIVTPYTQVDGSYHARPTFTGATGTTYVRFRPRIGNSFVDGNFITLTVEAPEVPMTSISLAGDALTVGLNKVIDVDYTYEPADATYTAVKIVSDNTKVATWSAAAGLKTTTTPGSALITVTSAYDGDVTASFTLNSMLLNPVTGVNFGPGTEDGVINVPVRGLIGLRPVIEPADADIPDVNIVLSGNGTDKSDMTCSTYKVNWWDNDGTRSQFFELSGHRPTNDAPAKLTVTSKDGSYTREFTVNVIEADRTPLAGGYTDGTIILNEEWFGHTNGGLNYVTKDNEIIYQAYERENPGMSFGATSQHGTIWAGKLIVASKQATDGGDPMPGGGRLVIADAATLKRIGSLDNLEYDGKKGDGRAVTGATPDKIYVGSSNGIYIVNIADPANPVITGRIGDEDSSDLYNGQIGDMVTAGTHAYAVMQNNGLIIIDVETDAVTRITDTGIQGVTQSADGNVWYCTLGNDDDGNARSVFVALDPTTTEEVDRVAMPSSIGTVVCGWGAWRSTAFKGSVEGNDLWFVTGSASIMGGASGDYYRYHIGDDPASIEPFFTLTGVKGINGFGEEVDQMTYGTPLFDWRNNRLIVMAGRKGAASGQYRDHWLHFVDGDSREISHTIKLAPYYWFQSLPIIPDKYSAEINLDDINVDITDIPRVIDLTGLVTDADNIDANIKLDIVTEAVADEADTAPADITLEGRTLTVTPNAKGDMMLTIKAESNGQVSERTVAVNVTDNQSGISDITGGKSITAHGTRLYINGYAGRQLRIHDISGVEVLDFEVDSDDYVLDFNGRSGVYAVSAGNETVKVIIRR